MIGRKGWATHVMASYSSRSFMFCVADSLVVPEPATEVTSSFTDATVNSR